MLHKQISEEQEVILFASCIIVCVIGTCILNLFFSKQYKKAAADCNAGYEAKPRHQLLRGILLYLLLNGGAGVLMFFLLYREDLHRFQN